MATHHAFCPGLWRGDLVWWTCHRSHIGVIRLHGKCPDVRRASPSHAVPQVFSSVIAAWSDVGDALAAGDPAVAEGAAWGLSTVSGVISKLNIGYLWMLVNCLTSAAYVSCTNSTNVGHISPYQLMIGLDHAQEDQSDWVLRLGLHVL